MVCVKANTLYTKIKDQIAKPYELALLVVLYRVYKEILKNPKE